MKKVILPIVFLLVSTSSYANSVQDQLAAVAQAEQQGKSEEQLQQNALQERTEKEVRWEKQRRAKAQAIAIQRARIAQAQQQMDKKRDQNYEDELRNLEIQRQKLELSKDEAKVKRENEYIDRELKSKDADIDVVKSEADVNRNLSEGGRDFLKSEGKASEKKASGWFK